MGYKVLGTLGYGGGSTIELAVDDRGRRVARKRLTLTGSADEVAVARMRLRREARILAGLQHPAIVPLLAVEDDGSDVVIVMPALRRSLAEKVKASGPVSISAAWRMGRPLIDALAWAHRRGVIHRDIKPSNVLLDDHDNPYLADFGVAWSRHMTGNLTRTGTIIGTVAYIAPEQVRGERAGPASDVFSLGATLLFSLTGQGPYAGGDGAATAVQAAAGEVLPLPEWLPESMARPLAAMVDPQPSRRPSAAGLLGRPSAGGISKPAPELRGEVHGSGGWASRSASSKKAVPTRPASNRGGSADATASPDATKEARTVRTGPMPAAVSGPRTKARGLAVGGDRTVEDRTVPDRTVEDRTAPDRETEDGGGEDRTLVDHRGKKNPAEENPDDDRTVEVRTIVDSDDETTEFDRTTVAASESTDNAGADDPTKADRG